MNKYLWCLKCKVFPDEIVEKYAGELKERRKWNGECYELADSNIDQLQYKSHCPNCDAELTEDQDTGYSERRFYDGKNKIQSS